MLNRKGFTLIELLVVVAIIAVLIAMLLPALSSAREMAKRAVCMSDVHQITLAANVYADDNAGWYPSISGYGATSCLPWWLDGAATQTFVPRYLSNPQVFYCPSTSWCPWDAHKEQWDEYMKNPSSPPSQYISYDLVFGSHSNVDSPWVRFRNYSGPDHLAAGKQVNDDGSYPVKSNRGINDPSKRVLVADGFNTKLTWLPVMKTVPYNHVDASRGGGAGSNEGFVDGHAEWKKPWQMQLQLYISYSEEWW